MKIINARLRGQPDLFTLTCENGVFDNIQAQRERVDMPADINADGNLLCAPFVEPHLHLDAVLTAGSLVGTKPVPYLRASNAGLNANRC
ncbi:hypothetical protein P4S72_05500 [Vibrio sp. PP-XX7]